MNPNRIYGPQTAQISAEILRADTRDTRRFPCGDADGPMRPAPFRRTRRRPWPRQATSVWRNLDQHPRFAGAYTFSAKEKDPETGLSYFGSRYYSSDLSVWLSVDPKSDKYPSLSPYVYCANNPVKLVDPNGEDFETEIDYDNYTITIKATFYTANSNRKELEKGIALWEEQSGKYTYSMGEEDNRTDFTIIFDLKIAEGDFETDDDALSAMSTMQSNNFFAVRDNVYDEKGEEVRGSCIGGNIIYVSNKFKNNRTAAHEIGHALGCGHAFESNDLMKSGGYGSNIGIKNIRAIMFFAGFDNSGIANVGNGRNGKSCDRLQLGDGCFWGNVIERK